MNRAKTHIDEDSYPPLNSSEIYKVLHIIGALDELGPEITRDQEWVFRKLEEIPSSITRILLPSENISAEEFLICSNHVQEVVDGILWWSLLPPKKPLIEKIASQLRLAIKNDHRSLQSLSLSYKYLKVFCIKYPPRKMKNSIHPGDDDLMYVERYPILDGEDSITIWNDTRVITADERVTLSLLVENMIQYAQVLSSISLHSPLDIETQKQCLRNEKENIECIKNILKEISKILSWGESRTPYITLCHEEGPFWWDPNEYWLRGAIRDLNRIFMQFSV